MDGHTIEQKVWGPIMKSQFRQVTKYQYKGAKANYSVPSSCPEERDAFLISIFIHFVLVASIRFLGQGRKLLLTI
jgi:hypothetical protein